MEKLDKAVKEIADKIAGSVHTLKYVKTKDAGKREWPEVEKSYIEWLQNTISSHILPFITPEKAALISENESLKAELLKALEAQRSMKEASESCYGACREFVRKVECGEARSIRSYSQMKDSIAQYEKASKG